MKGIIGGLWLGAMGAGAFLGLAAGIALFVLGAVLASCELVHELRAEKRAESWRKTYPSYKYQGARPNIYLRWQPPKKIIDTISFSLYYNIIKREGKPNKPERVEHYENCGCCEDGKGILCNSPLLRTEQGRTVLPLWNKEKGAAGRGRSKRQIYSGMGERVIALPISFPKPQVAAT